MKQRSEEEKLTQAPLKVRFGVGTYEIKPLPIKYSLPWVKKVVQILVGVLPLTQVTSNDSNWAEALGEVMINRPEQLIDALFEYATNLNKDEILAMASSEQIVRAFEGVIEMESPLLSMAMRAFVAATPKEDLALLLNTSSRSGTPTQ